MREKCLAKKIKFIGPSEKIWDTVPYQRPNFSIYTVIFPSFKEKTPHFESNIRIDIYTWYPAQLQKVYRCMYYVFIYTYFYIFMVKTVKVKLSHVKFL